MSCLSAMGMSWWCYKPPHPLGESPDAQLETPWLWSNVAVLDPWCGWMTSWDLPLLFSNVRNLENPPIPTLKLNQQPALYSKIYWNGVVSNWQAWFYFNHLYSISLIGAAHCTPIMKLYVVLMPPSSQMQSDSSECTWDWNGQNHSCIWSTCVFFSGWDCNEIKMIPGTLSR